MEEIILVKYGEIILKGLNRPIFENMLMTNIRKVLKGICEAKIKIAQATIYIDIKCGDIETVLEKLKKVSGIVYIIRAVKLEKNMEDICTKGIEYIIPELKKTFKVESKRSDKTFPLKSPEISKEVGGAILEKCPGLSVDVKNPDTVVMVEVRDFNAFVYCHKIAGMGGMPVGANGKATLLLSGGIDSPVAGFMIAKKGVQIDAVHFFSPPYTSERAKNKVIELCKILKDYTGSIKLHIVNFTDAQLEIEKNCKQEFLTVIMRRLMMKIAEKMANAEKSTALITGESLGQVASQTIEALSATDIACNLPVLRPLIAMDKDEIVKIARRIGTFEISVLPYEDCCTVFVPKHPSTKPSLEKVLKEEEKLDVENIIGNIKIEHIII